MILRFKVVDEEEAKGLPARLLVDPVQLVLWQQGAQFDDGVQLVLVAQPPAAEKLHVHPHGCADEPQLLGAHPGADLHVSASDKECIQGTVGLVELRAICVVVQDNQHLIQLLHLQLLGCLGDLALPLDDAPQRCLVPLVVASLLPFGLHPRVLLDVLLDGDPAVVDVYAGAEDVDFLKDSAVLLQNHADQRHSLAGLAGAEEDACAWNLGHHGVRGLFASVFSCGKELDLPHSFAFTSQIRRSALSEFSGIKLKAGMHLKHMGSKSWLAPHMDRLLGDVAVLHSSGKLEYYLAAQRPALEVRGVDAFEPVANLQRCYLGQDPVFLRSLLRLVDFGMERGRNSDFGMERGRIW